MIYTAKPLISEEEIKAVSEVLNSGMIAAGKKVKEFEKEFSSYIGTKHGIATSSGTTALDIMLKASGIKQGDEVIVPSFTFIATANSVLFQNAKPVFSDVDLNTYNITAEYINEKITSKTKAVIVVHLFGNPVDINPIKELCDEKGILLFEDAAQAHGAEYKGRKAGSLGLASSFSFYATKNMTTGEGGMILTNNKEISRKAHILIDQGQEKKYLHTVLGYNYRMTDIAASIGLVQLRKLEEMNKKRIENALFLTKHLSKVKGIITPEITKDSKHVYHQYVIRVVEEEYGLSREELIKRLNENGIFPAIHYPIPVHMQPLYKNLGYKEKLENTELLSKQVLSLPTHPLVEKKWLEKMVELIL